MEGNIRETLIPESSSVSSVSIAREAQKHWVHACSLKKRCDIARKFAQLIPEYAQSLHAAITTAQRCDYRETLSAELIPLADAAKWLSNAAPGILSSQKIRGFGRPLFSRRVHSVVHREPLGVVLVIGTWNYPLFLVGVQVLQGIVAGNSVIIKPAKGCRKVAELLVQILRQAGLPEGVCSVLGEEPFEATQTIAQGVDLIVLTGSSSTGRKVLADAANSLTPSVMELSGCDAVVALDSVDVQRLVSGILFGLRLNGGATCMAPRRLFMPAYMMNDLKSSLESRLEEVPSTTVDPRTIDQILSIVAAEKFEILGGGQRSVLKSSAEAGSEVISSVKTTDAGALEIAEEQLRKGNPLVFWNVSNKFPLNQSDVFAPVLNVIAYQELQEAIDACNSCRYQLTASVFGEENTARRVAAQLSVGMVVVNDLIAPTADPRISFGGRGESGFGRTRGVEGLLQMTHSKVISVNRGKWLPHLDLPQERDAPLLEGILQWRHAGSVRKAFHGLMQVFAAVSKPSQKKSK